MTDIQMSDYLSMTGSAIVRLYLWDMLRRYMPETWKPGSGMLTIPIIPAQDQPETQTGLGPYIVYDGSFSPTDDLYQIETERMTLRIFSEDTDVLTSTVKLCRRLFDRKDDSAFELNRWLDREDGLGQYAMKDQRYNTWMEEARNVKFLTTSVVGTEGAAPAETQEGRLDTLVFLDLTYVEHEWASPFSKFA